MNPQSHVPASSGKRSQWSKERNLTTRNEEKYAALKTRRSQSKEKTSGALINEQQFSTFSRKTRDSVKHYKEKG